MGSPPGSGRPGRSAARLWLARGARLVRWLAVLAGCYLGGVAATNLAPTTVETSNYAATIRLAPVPERTAVLHSPTVVGDVDLDFASPFVAPGIEVSVAVKDSITSVFTSRDLDIATLQPTPEEISAALRDAATGVGWRFVSGAGVVAISVLLAVYYARNRRLNRRHATTVVSAFLVGCVATGAGILVTYRTDNFASYRTTGLLLELERNKDVFQDISARSSQVTPYVLNLLALSKALRDNLVPAQLDQSVSSRILLVSDIHGQNQYGLMRSIIDSEGIDAVIDTGDLVNFGTDAEATAAGIFTGIQSLGVPYIFTSGNHDQSSPTDRALLRRLAQIPNVVLLQPDDSTYTAYTLKGLRITGFNDPRYFGDDAQNTDEKQKPAVEQFNRTMDAQPTPDVVVAHEPGAASGADKGDVRINGHLHAGSIDGNRITVGTFTGGGVVSHYIPEGDGELLGQPYAFDIAAFDTSCRLSSLTRYTYRNLIEGAPVYDNVTVVNGSTIEAAPQGEAADRTCGVGSVTGKETIPAVSADAPGDGTTTAP